MWVIVTIDIWCHRQNILRLIENRENPADLQEGLKKDIAKLQNKRERKLEKNAIKQDKIENRYNKKIVKKETRVKSKIEKIHSKSSKKNTNATSELITTQNADSTQDND